MKHALILLVTILATQHATVTFAQQPVGPDTVGNWILPAQGIEAMPVWGIKDGISFGLAPMAGPRGLIRIYCPYINTRPRDVVNFIAMEPIPVGTIHRGYSELEMSSLDPGKRGKRFWSADHPDHTTPGDVRFPARGIITELNGEEVLSVYVFSEAFDNGARVYVGIRIYETRPYELEITTHTYDESVSLSSFITTATMGNKTRLRTLFLNERTVTSGELWPAYRDIHFTDHARFSSGEMITDQEGKIYFIAAPDETDYNLADYHPSTAKHWQIRADIATQYWMKKQKSGKLEGVVNGRYYYWASQAPIPGGISFENFELNENFSEGSVLVFGIQPLSPQEFLQNLNK